MDRSEFGVSFVRRKLAPVVPVKERLFSKVAFGIFFDTIDPSGWDGSGFSRQSIGHKKEKQPCPGRSHGGRKMERCFSKFHGCKIH